MKPEAKKLNAVGTPDYMAPEMINGTGTLSHSVDWWAIGCIIYELINKVSPKTLQAIAYISFIAILITIPGVSPIADYAIEQIGKIGLLPLCTPIRAYAGISIGKDVDTFKKQGFAIVVVAIFTFAGTFLGSTIIAQIILKMTGVI